MDDKRKLELFEKALDWIQDSSSSRADLYNTLSEGLGMTDEEIIEEKFSSLADFMSFDKKLQLSAFIRYDRNTLVIPLPTDLMNLRTKLSSIGLRPDDPLFITDHPEMPIRIKLMTENNLGCHLIRLFDENDRLMDASETIYKIDQSPEEIWSELRKRLVSDQYSDYKQLLGDVAELISQAGEYSTTFYFPLLGSLDDGFGDTDQVSNGFLRSYRYEIEELIEKEQSSDTHDMKDYFDDDQNARQKMITAKWGVEEIDGELYGKVDFRSREPFTAEEKEIVREWVLGQNSDGFGEGLEQREIETEDGDLYVSMWNFSDDYFVLDEAEMEAHLADQQQGGIGQ